MNNTSDDNLKVGTLLNEKWVILEFIAKGGMGEVYRAHQLSLRRDVAIKIISKEWLEVCRENEEEFQSTVERFRNEVQAMAQLRHPNILQIYDSGSFFTGEGDRKVSREYMVMEYAPGGTLKATMSKEGFYPEEDLTREWLLDYFLPLLDGVQAMHESGIVHRDLKPGNILLEGKTPKIADFGLARSSRCKPVTQSIDVKGTLCYMAPEQFLDLKRTDHRADIYSLGKILFEAIAGEKSRDTKPLKRACLNNPDGPFFKKLDRLIQAATEEDRGERLGSVREMRDSILDALGTTVSTGEEAERSNVSTPTPFPSAFKSKKRVWGGIILATILLVLVGLWHWDQMERSRKYPPFSEGLEITNEKQKPFVPGKAGFSPSESLPKTLEAKEGVTMGLIPGGKFTFPENFGVDSGKTVEVNSFYMDETRVTNHQYVEFLNNVLSKLRVEKGVVQSGGEVWLLLGEVFEGYEPIVFRDGKFHVNQPEHASCPVLRVTGYGASAYARFYGRRLPTEAEWLYALVEGAQGKEKAPGNAPEPAGNAGTGGSMSAMMTQMHEGTEAPAPGTVDLSPMPPPVMLSKPNAYGIRGLEERIGEWALWRKEASTDGQKDETQYVILRGASGGRSKGAVSPSGVTRQPWEAFGDVSFRCVLSGTDARR